MTLSWLCNVKWRNYQIKSNRTIFLSPWTNLRVHISFSLIKYTYGKKTNIITFSSFLVVTPPSLTLPFTKVKISNTVFSHTLIYLWRHATISKLTATNRFSKRLWLRWLRNPLRVFLYHCISDGNWLSTENVGCNVHFILHVMSDKAVFVSRALLCVQPLPGKPLFLPL